MISFFIILGIVLWIAFAFWPAVIAKKKGYGVGGFIGVLILSWAISFLLGLVFALLLPDKSTPAPAAQV
ncbi:MAG: hypothetical protein AAB462_02445 [Patescibacteria group bacterium]